MTLGLRPISRGAIGSTDSTSGLSDAPAVCSIATSQLQQRAALASNAVVFSLSTVQGKQTAISTGLFDARVTTTQAQSAAILLSNVVVCSIGTAQTRQSIAANLFPNLAVNVVTAQSNTVAVNVFKSIATSVATTQKGQSQAGKFVVPMATTVVTGQNQRMVGSAYVGGDIQSYGALSYEFYSLTPDIRVELFQLDTTVLGGGIFYFTTTKTTVPILFGGISYPYAGVEASGFELTARGSLPTPTITVSNPNSVLRGIAITMKDMLGATVRRIRTSYRFTGNGSTPDNSQHLPIDIYYVEQKTAHNKLTISWQLSALLDKQGRSLPQRQILRDTCLHTYRKWNPTTGQFDYSKATCPYVGDRFYQIDGHQTGNPAHDVCGKQVYDCKVRFGATGLLPTRAFPGVTTGIR